jgi:hypothetical protein
MPAKALHDAWRRSIYHLVVLDRHAGRRKLGRCRSRLSHFPKTYAEGAESSESNPAPPRLDPLRMWARIAPSFGDYGDYKRIRKPAYLYIGVTNGTGAGPNEAPGGVILGRSRRGYAGFWI